MAEDPFPLPNHFLLLLRGLFKHCPRCGGGHLFKSWMTMVERCPKCGFKFEREPGFFLGALVVNSGVIIITLSAFIAISIAITLPDPDPVILAVMAVVLAIAVPIAFYPYSKTVWSGIDLWMHPPESPEVESAEAARGGAALSDPPAS